MRVGDDVAQFDVDGFLVGGQKYTDNDLPIEMSEFTLEAPVSGDEHDPKSRLNVIEMTDKSTVSIKIKPTRLMGDFFPGKPYDRVGHRMYYLEVFTFEWQVNPE